MSGKAWFGIIKLAFENSRKTNTILVCQSYFLGAKETSVALSYCGYKRRSKRQDGFLRGLKSLLGSSAAASKVAVSHEHQGSFYSFLLN